MSCDTGLLEEAVTRWAARHPHPEEPAFQMGSGKLLSPRDLAEQIRMKTQTGKLMLRVLEHSAKRYSVQEILDSFTKAAAGH